MNGISSPFYRQKIEINEASKVQTVKQTKENNETKKTYKTLQKMTALKLYFFDTKQKLTSSVHV